MHCYTCVVKSQLAFWGHQSCDQPYWLAQSHLPTLLPTAWGHTPLLGSETNSTTNTMGTHTTLLHYEQHGDTHHFWEVTSFRYTSLALWFSHVSPSTQHESLGSSASQELQTMFTGHSCCCQQEDGRNHLIRRKQTFLPSFPVQELNLGLSHSTSKLQP